MKPAIKQFTHAFFKIPQNERKKNGRKGARIAGYEPYSPEEDAYLIEHYQKNPVHTDRQKPRALSSFNICSFQKAHSRWTYRKRPTLEEISLQC